MGATGSPTFDPETVRNVLESPAGKALLQLLQQDGGATLRQAADALRAGDPAKAQSIVAPLMQNEQAARLTAELNRAEQKRRHGGT